MLNDLFFEKFNFSANYFNTLLELTKQGKRDFPQAIIFEGIDTKLQYLFSLELARILNCEKDAKPDCDCINCKWIRSHQHPSVVNVSELHFKGDNDETKTVISAQQARKIEQSLTLSSDYHRFFIFFSSKNKTYDPFELNDFYRLKYSTDIDFDINPLEYSTFHPAAPNALLKSIEEPPKRTTFIFLTKSKENIISTIVSRCLVFKLSSDKKADNVKTDTNLFSDYLNLNNQNCFDFSDKILNYIKDNETTLNEVLNLFISYLLELIKSNSEDNSIYLKITNDISLISHAIKQSRSNMQDKIVLEALLLKIIRGF